MWLLVPEATGNSCSHHVYWQVCHELKGDQGCQTPAQGPGLRPDKAISRITPQVPPLPDPPWLLIHGACLSFLSLAHVSELTCMSDLNVYLGPSLDPTLTATQPCCPRYSLFNSKKCFGRARSRTPAKENPSRNGFTGEGSRWIPSLSAFLLSVSGGQRNCEWSPCLVRCACMCAKSPQSCLTLCDPMAHSPPGTSVHVHQAPGKNTRVGCHALLQGIVLTQGSNPHLLCLSHW